MNPNEILRGLEDFQKAISTTPVTGIQLVRQDLQSEMVMIMPTETPLRNRIGRIEGNGNAHAFYRLKPTQSTDGTGRYIGTTPANGFFAKGGLPTDATPSFDYVATPYYNVGDIARVTFQDQAQGRSYVDLRAQQMRLKMINVGLMEEWAIINGDSAVGGGLVWDGLYKQITANGGQNYVSPDGKLTLPYVRQLQYNQVEAGGQPSLLVMDGLGRAVLTQSVVQYLYEIRQNGGASIGEVASGLSMASYDFGYGQCEWIYSRYINPAKYTAQSFVLSLDISTNDGKNTGNTISMVDVDPLHSVDLAVVQTSWPTLVYETSTLMVTAPQFQGILTGVSYSGQTPFTGNV